MAAARSSRTGVARMLPAFVAQIQRDRVQRGEPVPHGLLDCVHYWGNVFRSGFTVIHA